MQHPDDDKADHPSAKDKQYLEHCRHGKRQDHHPVQANTARYPAEQIGPEDGRPRIGHHNDSRRAEGGRLTQVKGALRYMRQETGHKEQMNAADEAEQPAGQQAFLESGICPGRLSLGGDVAHRHMTKNHKDEH